MAPCRWSQTPTVLRMDVELPTTVADVLTAECLSPRTLRIDASPLFIQTFRLQAAVRPTNLTIHRHGRGVLVSVSKEASGMWTRFTDDLHPPPCLSCDWNRWEEDISGKLDDMFGEPDPDVPWSENGSSDEEDCIDVPDADAC